jgi:hypothetical protein
MCLHANLFLDINRVIEEAYDGVEEDSYWLADDFSKAPRRTQIGDTPYTQVETGTEPPIQVDWISPFKGKTVQDCVLEISAR